MHIVIFYVLIEMNCLDTLWVQEEIAKWSYGLSDCQLLTDDKSFACLKNSKSGFQSDVRLLFSSL